MVIVGRGGGGDVSAVLNDPIGPGVFEIAAGHGCKECNHSGASGLPRANSRRRIFYNDSVGGRKSQLCRGLQVRLGIRLPDLHVARGNHGLGDGQARSAQAHLGQRART